MENKNLKLLGLKGRDKVTGLSGIVTSLSFDLYGCIQVILTQPVSKEGVLLGGEWFDLSRIEIPPDQKPVIKLPDFDKLNWLAEGSKGCANKPMP